MNNIEIEFKNKKYLLNLKKDETICNGYLCEIKNETKLSMGELMNIKFKNEYLELKIIDYYKLLNETIIKLWCYPDQNRKFSPKKDVIFINENQIDIYSHHGCEICDDKIDFKEIIGKCENGKRYHFLEKINQNCFSNKVEEPFVSSCSTTITFPFWTLISIPIIFILFILIFISIIVLLFVRLRKLENSYKELKDKNQQVDINDINDI